jgi:RNA polymerase sigma-70 factor (ECF subfamily)
MSERAAFLEFRDRPSTESLVRLLQVNQGRVFRLCYHVLHNAHDAEDAAQAALMKVLEDVRRFSDPDEFRRWLYRVSLNAALQALRGVSRRRAHEARAAMEKPKPKLPDLNERLALFEAIAALDDGARGLILERYFEGETLESIAQRSGASTSTVFNKLEEARASLRKSLGGAVALEAWFTASPPAPDLVTGAVLAKVAAVAGGTIMATKVVVGLSVAIALACLVGGGVVGAALKGRSHRSKVQELERRLVAAEKRSEVAPIHPGMPAPKTPEAEPVRDVSPKEAVSSKLREKLARYRAWTAIYFKEYDELSARDPGNVGTYRARKLAEMGELLVGVRDMTIASPGEFLEFVRDPRNETYLSSLILRGLGFKLNDTYHHGQEFRIFPLELHQGLQDLLMTGSLRQKTAMLEYFALVWNQPAEFKAVYPQFLNEPDPGFQVQVVRTIAQSNSWTDEAFTAVARLGNTTENSDVRGEIGNAMMWHPGPKPFSYLLDRLEGTSDYQEAISVAQTLGNKMTSTYQRNPPPGELEDRIGRAVTVAMTRGFDGATFLTVVRPALVLPADKLKPILQQALALAPTEHSRKTIGDLIQRVQAGDFTPDDLRRVSWGEKNN